MMKSALQHRAFFPPLYPTTYTAIVLYMLMTSSPSLLHLTRVAEACAPPLPPSPIQRDRLLLPTVNQPQAPPPLFPTDRPTIRMSPAAAARVYGEHMWESENAQGNSPVQLGKTSLLALPPGLLGGLGDIDGPRGQPSIREAYELYCGDFDERCRWRNLEGLFIDELDWYQGAGFLDESRLRLATGTHIRPDGYYGIAATDKVEFPNAKAVLVSDVVGCQLGMAELRFHYWTSPEVRLVVCIKSVARLYPDYDFCSQPPVESGDPGPASISLPDLNGQPFQIFIRAENFIYHSGNLQGGFAIIDNIEYNGVLCASSGGDGGTTNQPTSELPVANEEQNVNEPPPQQKQQQYNTFLPRHAPANTILPPMIQPPQLPADDTQQHRQKKNNPLLSPEPLLNRSIEGPHGNRLSVPDFTLLKSIHMDRRPYPQVLEYAGSLSRTARGDEPYNPLLLEHTHDSANSIAPRQNEPSWNVQQDGSPATFHHTLPPPPNWAADHDACLALNCSFDDHCAEYVLQPGVDWLLATHPVGNRLSGIRGDASRLPHNRDGTFVYVAGPKTLSRFTTRPFTLREGVYLMFAYHKVVRRVELRLLAKRADAAEEVLLFDAPHPTIESRRWHREVRRLDPGSYDYIAFEVRDLPSNAYVGIDELVLLDTKTRMPICNSPAGAIRSIAEN